MKKTPAEIEADKAVIAHLGGPTKLAQKLGFPPIGGVQRVYNWLDRGIPAYVWLQHIEIFSEAERETRSAKLKRKAA